MVALAADRDTRPADARRSRRKSGKTALLVRAAGTVRRVHDGGRSDPHSPADHPEIPSWEVLMNRRELVLALAERADTDRRTADEMLSSLVDVITETVSTGEPVAISGFAKFARVDRKARMGRNPQTGEAIKIKASRKARITPLKAFKDSVMTGKRAGGRKTAAKKTTAKKTAVRKAPAKKATARKTTAKKTAKRTTRR
jgi:DNA-binding protein HU-beta